MPSTSSHITFSQTSVGAQDFKKLSRALRKYGDEDAMKKFRKKISDAGRPVLRSVKDAVRSLDVKGTPGGGTTARKNYALSRAGTDKSRLLASRQPHGLRASVARATSLNITDSGVRFVCRGIALPPSQRNLPRHLDSEKGWRHPLFGNRARWYQERGGPWFQLPILRRAYDFHDAILEAIQETIDDIEKAIG